MLNLTRHMAGRFKALFVLVVMLCCFSNTLEAQETDYKAYSLYVYNFMKYIEWPENQDHGDFIIAVFGKSAIEKELQNLAAKKKIRGRNIVVKSISNLEQLDHCQLLYITREKSNQTMDAADRLSGKGILIVGEREGLAYRGAALSFAVTESDELSFDINKRVIEQQRLKISGTLIQLGAVVVK